MSADDLLAGPVEQIDVAHLAAEHRAACDEIHRLRDEVFDLRTVVCLLVDRFHEDTPMGPNVVDLPARRWRRLPPHVAGAVRRALYPHLLAPTTATRKDQHTL